MSRGAKVQGHLAYLDGRPGHSDYRSSCFQNDYHFTLFFTLLAVVERSIQWINDKLLFLLDVLAQNCI